MQGNVLVVWDAAIAAIDDVSTDSAEPLLLPYCMFVYTCDFTDKLLCVWVNWASRLVFSFVDEMLRMLPVDRTHVACAKLQSISLNL